ncbi:TPA: DUF3383 domain-containing protein [Vibrio cholerae]|nr:DUF3383 domain-containing protein [Vibrio cholerae]
MPFVPSVQSITRLSTVAAAGANLNNSIFIAAHNYFRTATKPYYTMEDVNNDKAIPTYSNAYKALQQAFKQVGGASPIYLGRIDTDSVTFTPTVQNSKPYKIKCKVFDKVDLSDVESFEMTFTSDTDANANEIVAGLITSVAVSPTEVTFSSVGDVLKFTPSAGHQIIIEEATSNLVQSYEHSVTGAEAYAAVEDEANEDFYFVTSESRDLTFVKSLADAVEATENSDYKKQYRVASSALSTLTILTDPAAADDLLGKLYEAEYTRTMGEWHDQADNIFPELAACVKVGGYFAGAVNWKFLQNTAPAARHPDLGRLLNKTEQGYIADRNASWVGKERRVSFMHGGTNAIGTSHWSDLVQIKDWVDDQIEVRVLTALLNANNGGLPLTMTRADLAIVKERVESVLIEGVERKLFASFDPVKVPDSISFSDQAARILKDVTYNAYFASKINFAIINGNLTYKEELA